MRKEVLFMARTTNFLLGFIAGAAVGASTALLMAPTTGTETRSRLKGRLDTARQKASETGSRIASRSGEIARQTRERVGVIGQQTQQRMQTMGKINLNQATRDQLISLEGIGPAVADDIIRYREERGGFRSLDELDNVYGFEETLTNKVKKQVYI
jgi:competence ComEA-like helix-hairpin-helix protein